MTRPRIRALALGASLLMLVSLLAACGGSSSTGGNTSTAKKIKVGLVTDIGGLNDKSFNHLAYVGLQKAQSELGVQTSVKESKSGDDYVPNLTGYASSGYDLVVAVGFLMGSAVGQVSQQFPNVHFAIIDSGPTDANGNAVTRNNVISLLFKEQEAGALVGTIVGVLEKDGLTPKKSHVVSAVGGISIPPVNHYIAGYQWAVKQQDPSAKVLIGYSNDFQDSTKCRAVANSQIGSGSDVVFQVAGGCGNGALQAAGQQHVYSIGVDADQKDVDPSVILSALKQVDIATFDAIKFIQDGTLPTAYQATGEAACDAATRTCPEFLFNLKNDGVGYAVDNLTNMPADATAAVQDIESKIKSGAVTVPDTIQS